MTEETKLKKQLLTAKEWARKSRVSNEPHFISHMGLLYMQVAIEQIINYLDMKAIYENDKRRTKKA